jgi:DNA ligase-1
MSSNLTYNLLQALSETPGKNKKLELLRLADAFDLRVFKAALDPYTTYGIANIEYPPAAGNDAFSDTTWRLLGDLAARRLTGNRAKSAIASHMVTLTPRSKHVLRRVLTKDLKCGVKAALINEAHPGTVPVFGMQLSEAYDPARVQSWPVWVEPKFDGLRAILVHDPGATPPLRFYSKNGLPFETLDGLAELIRQGSNLRDGEVVFLDGEITSGQFNDTVSQVKRKKASADDAVYNVFDYFSPGGLDLTQQQRRANLEEAFGTNTVDRMVLAPGVWCADDAQVRAEARRIWEQGGEGVIVKDAAAPYELKRSYAWMKVKKQESEEFPVLRVFPGTGKNSHRAGGVVVDLGNSQECSVAGFTEAALDALWAARDSIAGRVLEVAFHERTPDGSLRHPRAIKFRDTNTGEIE